MLKGQGRRRGFTLIETVVTVGIVAALAAVVYPQVVKQFDTADPTRAVEDLNSIRTGIEVFNLNVRPQQPGDIEDLVNRVVATTAGETNPLGSQYATADNLAWNGPYLGVSILNGTAPNAEVITTGFGAKLWNEFARFDVDASTLVGGDSTNIANANNADFVAVRIVGLSGAAFNALNLTVDGPNETSVVLRRSTGRLRCSYPSASVPANDAVCPMAFYLATPLRQ